jgi:predicted ribosomally synthesized six-cysteine peptide SCIFF
LPKAFALEKGRADMVQLLHTKNAALISAWRRKWGAGRPSKPNRAILGGLRKEQKEEAMKHIKTISKGSVKAIQGKGCGECQTSCQSACKTSCTVANQECENVKIKRR